MTLDRSAGLAESARALADGGGGRPGARGSGAGAHRGLPAVPERLPDGAAEAALAEAEAADRELARRGSRPLLGVPVAVKDDMDVAGEPTAFGCQGEFPPVAEDGEAVRQAARCRSHDRRQDQHLRARAVALHRGARLRRHPQSVAHRITRPAARRVVRPPPSPPVWCPPRSARTGRARCASPPPGPTWSASNRNAAGSRPGRAREAFQGITVNGTLARTVADAALLLDAASGGHARRPAPSGAVRAPRRWAATRAGCASRCPQAAVHRRARPARPAVRAQVVANSRNCWPARSHVEEAEPRYGRIGLDVRPARHSRDRRACPRGAVPDAARPADPGRRAAGPAARRGAVAGGPAGRGGAAPAYRRALQPYDVVLAPTTAAPPPRIGALHDLGGIGTDRAMIAACPYAWPWNVLGWPGVNVPAGFVATGCRSARNCSGRPPASRCSSRWRPSWRTACGGTSTGRRRLPPRTHRPHRGVRGDGPEGGVRGARGEGGGRGGRGSTVAP